MMLAVKLAVKQLIKERDEEVCDLVAEEAEDAALIKIMDGIPNSPAVSREKVFKTLRSER